MNMNLCRKSTCNPLPFISRKKFSRRPRNAGRLLFATAAPTAPPGGGTVLDKPQSDVIFSKVNKKLKPPMYKVLLHNDNSNKREYVVKVLLKVVDLMTVDDAVNIMQEAHVKGVALVTVTAQEVAEIYVAGLRRNGLTSTLEPESGGNGGDSC